MSNNSIFMPGFVDIGPGDPLWSKVVALLKMDAFPITDYKNHTVDSDNVSITSANSQYGSSAVFNGVDSAIRIQPTADQIIGTQDFVHEARIRINARPASQAIIFTNAPPSGTQFANTTIGINLMAGGNVRVQSSYSVFITGGIVLPLNQEVHIAVARIAGTMRLFVDGVLDGSTSSALNFSDNIQFMIGKENIFNGNVGQTFNGQVDEFRTTIGDGRYSGGFTVPPAFPTH